MCRYGNIVEVCFYKLPWDVTEQLKLYHVVGKSSWNALSSESQMNLLLIPKVNQLCSVSPRLPECCWAFQCCAFVVVPGTVADLVVLRAVSSTAKNQMQKMLCQSMLSCDLKSLLTSLRNSHLANPPYQLTSRMPGQAAVWRGGFAFGRMGILMLLSASVERGTVHPICGMAELQYLGLLPLCPLADLAQLTKQMSIAQFSR